ncbi:hypothetical protein V5O48_011760 [Marasmius crinis-equi]|uniref:Uncharacterized protein n=1 Tax=Marasmius crinis-equi TaxID=585013 RepID=A0ABR3F4N8_9AGAR
MDHIDQEELTHLERLFEDKQEVETLLEQRGEDAQIWLDRLQVLVDDPDLNTTPQLRSSMLTVMIRLSKLSGLHPKCLSIQNVHKLGHHPVASGGFGDVWKGVVGDSRGPIVCLKVVKVYVSSDVKALFREYLREAIVWRQLKHPNLLPFLGIYYLQDESQFCLVSPWMEKGNLMQYLKTAGKENVDHLALVYDVATGLAYLHYRKVVHGDLKGVNILITPDGRACIADFGLSRIADTHALRLTTSTSRPAGTGRWLAPEILSVESGPTKESDVYAFGCIFTGRQPFHELPNEMAVAVQVLVNKRRPLRPKETPELSDEMWNLLELCWDSKPTSRPTAARIVERVESMIKIDRASVISPAKSWSDAMFAQIWNNVEHEYLPLTEPASQTPLEELLETEGEYIDLLQGLIKKIATTWSKDNMPPVRLDAMFRTIENICRLHHDFYPELRNARLADPKKLVDLLLHWPDDLKTPYTSYLQIYHSGLDSWTQLKANTLLSSKLAKFSSKKPPTSGTSWTLDTLFMLPMKRLQYYKAMYQRMFGGNALEEVVEKLDGLLAIHEERKDMDVSEPLMPSWRTYSDLGYQSDRGESKDRSALYTVTLNGSSPRSVNSEDWYTPSADSQSRELQERRNKLKIVYQHSRSPSPTPVSSPVQELGGRGSVFGVQ